MNFKEIRYILEIAHSGSISAAADKIGISQSSLSRFLFRIEKQYGVSLFNRSAKKLEPTSAGKKYLAISSQLLPLLEKIECFTEIELTNFIVPLLLGVSGTIDLAEIEKFCYQLEPQFRITPINLSSNDAVTQVVNGAVDILLTSDKLSNSLLYGECIQKETFSLIVPHSVDNLLVGHSWSSTQLIAEIQKRDDSRFVLFGESGQKNILHQLLKRIFPTSQHWVYTTNPLLVEQLFQGDNIFGLAYDRHISKLKENMFFSIFPLDQEKFFRDINLFLRKDKVDDEWIEIAMQKLKKYIISHTENY